MENRIWYIKLACTTNYVRSFLIQAPTVKEAINAINYQGRKAIKEEIAKHGNSDPYQAVVRIKHVVNTTRRILRKHKDRFAACYLDRLAHAIDLTNVITPIEIHIDWCRDRFSKGLWDKLPDSAEEFIAEGRRNNK